MSPISRRHSILLRRHGKQSASQAKGVSAQPIHSSVPTGDTGLGVADWIDQETGGDLEIAEVGSIDTSEGKVVFLDPPGFSQMPNCRPRTNAATTAFANELDTRANLYDDCSSESNDRIGGERKILKLPDGTPVPYVHSGYGDGAYGAIALHDSSENVCAVYADFMGFNDKYGAWLVPPGVAGNGK